MTGSATMLTHVWVLGLIPAHLYKGLGVEGTPRGADASQTVRFDEHEYIRRHMVSSGVYLSVSSRCRSFRCATFQNISESEVDIVLFVTDSVPNLDFVSAG